MMANKEDLYRLEKLVNTPGADEDEIRVLRKALWGKSYDRPREAQLEVLQVFSQWALEQEEE